jgi:hypothetical protein
MSLSVPVWVEEKDGVFVASVLGRPDLTATAPKGDLAVASLRAVLAGHRDRGRLVLLDLSFPPPPTLSAAEEAEAWRELCEEIYRERDAQKAAAVAEYDRT